MRLTVNCRQDWNWQTPKTNGAGLQGLQGQQPWVMATLGTDAAAAGEEAVEAMVVSTGRTAAFKHE